MELNYRLVVGFYLEKRKATPINKTKSYEFYCHTSKQILKSKDSLCK